MSGRWREGQAGLCDALLEIRSYRRQFSAVLEDSVVFLRKNIAAKGQEKEDAPPGGAAHRAKHIERKA